MLEAARRVSKLSRFPMHADPPRALRLGVIGVGDRGRAYARALAEGGVPGAELAAAADIAPEALAVFPAARHFTDEVSLFAAGLLDAVVIATPPAVHGVHTRLALAAGLHVLTEKPLASRIADCKRLRPEIEQAARRGRVVSTAFPLRADARYRELARLLERREIGRLQRVHWTVTDCFRTDAYYRASAWRSTREGEGGGVLLNQALHQLDLWQLLFGMPRRVQGFCAFGRFHAIEVEDQVTAYLEHADGMTGVFVAGTGEPLGTNRLEIHGAHGRILLEGGDLVVERTAHSVSDVAARARIPAPAEVERRTLTVGGLSPAGMLQNFVAAIRGGAPLVSPASEGTRAIELAHAISASSEERRPVEPTLESVTQASIQAMS
jgi:predicted dehydrogenase